ncbi:MAG: class I SAM-dependent methyltransferase family protein [Patescibacteria group bacterium]
MADTLHYVGRARFAPARRQEQIEGYETLSWPYRLALPVMNIIAVWVNFKKALYAMFRAQPKTNFYFVDGLSVSARRVKDHATSWQALDTVYNFNRGVGPNAFVRAIDWFWLHTRNAQAARNRLKMAKQALAEAIFALAMPGEPVRILSLAAGSAQGVIEVMAEMNTRGIRVESFLVDKDPKALTFARALAREHGIDDRLHTAVGDVIYFERHTNGFKPDIIEMMGLTDYLRNALAVLVFKKIRRHLKPGGYFFTSNVHPNPEAFSLKAAMNWDMLYRTPTQLADLLIEGGFLTPRVVTEAHGIQSFVSAQKISA